MRQEPMQQEPMLQEKMRDKQPSSAPPRHARAPAAAPICLFVGLLLLLLAGRLLNASTFVAAARALGALLVLAATVLRATALRRIARTGGGDSASGWAVAGYLGAVVAVALHLWADALGGNDSLRGDGDVGAALVRVLWVGLGVISLATLVFVERAWLSMSAAFDVDHCPSPRRLRHAGYAGGSTGLLLVGLFALNYAATTHDARWDLSYFQTTQPGSATIALVAEADQPIEALLFFAPVDEVLADLRPYFEALAAASPKLRLRVVDQALEPELAREAKVRGNGWVLFRKRKAGAETDGGGDKDANNAATSGASEAIEIGEDRERARRNLSKLDGLVHRALAHLGRPARRLALTSGHDERDRDGRPGDADSARLRSMHALLDRFAVDTTSLGMADGLAQAVPADTPAVAILGPRKPLLAEECAALLRYVQGGGRLLILADPDADDGLDPLLAGLGLLRRAGVVANEGHYMRRTHTPADAAVVYSNAYSTHPTVTTVARNAARVATVLSRGASFQAQAGPAKIPGATASFTLHSSDDFWRDIDGDLQRGTDEPLERLELMAAVAVKVGDSVEGRAVVIGDGDFVSDAQIANLGNGALFVDALRWLIGDEEVGGEVESEEDIAIEHRDDGDKVWFYATTFAAPLPLLLVGLWLGRRNRRGLRRDDAGRA